MAPAKSNTQGRVMISNRKKKLALIHIAKDTLQLSDEDYRTLLWGCCGIESAKFIEYEDQFESIMAALSKLGFQSWKRQGKTNSRPEWKHQWRCSSAQRAKIEVMWQIVARNKAERSLWVFCKRITGIDHPAWMDKKMAQGVIIALSKMMEKAGYDPATGGKLEKKC